MTHIAAACAAALFFLVAGEESGAAQETHAHRAARRDGPCAEALVTVDQEAQRVVVSLSNSCEARVGCTVRWGLRCDHARAVPQQEEVSLSGHGEARVEASARACGHGDWQITPPTWRCQDPPTERIDGPHRRRRLGATP